MRKHDYMFVGIIHATEGKNFPMGEQRSPKPDKGSLVCAIKLHGYLPTAQFQIKHEDHLAPTSAPKMASVLQMYILSVPPFTNSIEWKQVKSCYVIMYCLNHILQIQGK